MFTDDEIGILKGLLDNTWKTKPMQALYAKLEKLDGCTGIFVPVRQIDQSHIVEGWKKNVDGEIRAHAWVILRRLDDGTYLAVDPSFWEDE